MSLSSWEEELGSKKKYIMECKLLINATKGREIEKEEKK